MYYSYKISIAGLRVKASTVQLTCKFMCVLQSTKSKQIRNNNNNFELDTVVGIDHC